MATKRHKFLSPPGQCIEIFNGGGVARLIKTAPQHLAGKTGQIEEGDMMSIAFSLSGESVDDDELMFADEDDDEMVDMLHFSPFLKR